MLFEHCSLAHSLIKPFFAKKKVCDVAHCIGQHGPTSIVLPKVLSQRNEVE